MSKIINLPGLPQDPKIEGRERLAVNLDKLRAVLRAQSLVASELELEDVAGNLTDIAMLLEQQHQAVETAITTDSDEGE